MKKLLFGSAFVLAIGGAFLANASVQKTSLDDQSGFTDASGPCQQTNVPDDCSTDNTGAVCTHLHLQSNCSDILKMPEQQ